MSVTMDGDFTVIDDADATTLWTGRAPISNISIATAGHIEGGGCIEGRLQTGTGDATYNHGALDLTDQHLYCWFRPTAPIDTLLNAGVTMRISGTVGGGTNYGQWNVGGSDLGVIGSAGWINFVVDILKVFDSINGTPPVITAPVDSGIGGKFLGGPGMAQIVIDAFTRGNTAIVRGGTGGSPGLWAEAATADIENGHIKNIAGAFFINSRVRFGDSVGTTSTEFSDINGLILFETNLFMAGDLCGFEFAGNSTGTNNVEFGSASGSGVDKVGASGGVWSSSGQRPFRVEAKNADMDSIGIFGVTMLNSPALWDDPVRNFKVEDGGAFTDDTRDFTDPGTADVSPFPTPAVDDAMYLGHNVRFHEINIDTGTAKSGTYTLLWEYFNGSSWALLTDLTDGTNGLTTTGSQTVTYAIPDDWAKNTVDTDNRYWIRLRISAFTSSSTVPLIDEGSVALAGDVELEVSACEVIDCVMSAMGAVRVRNGAFLKRSTIAGSITNSKHAALDLGGADPSANTVRDLTIANNFNGILLKGSGNVTYNFRNIKFSGNTNDVRVDFGSSDTVTINVLEGGDTPSISKVDAGTTVIVENPQTTKFTVQNAEGTVLQNVRVMAETGDDGGGSGLPFEESISITQTGGTATATHTAHGLASNDFVAIRGAQPDNYNKVVQITVTGTNTYTYLVNDNPSSPATGTPIASYIAVTGLTDVNGEIEAAKTWPASQSLDGYARLKNTSTPFYADANITIADASAGTDVILVLQLDE